MNPEDQKNLYLKQAQDSSVPQPITLQQPDSLPPQPVQNNNISAQSPVYSSPLSTTGSKRRLIILASSLFLLITAIFFLVIKPGKSNNSSISSSSGHNQKNLLEGYVAYETSCYKIQLPSDKFITTKNDCHIVAKFNAEQTSGINITSFIKYRENLISNVNFTKKNESMTGTLIKEESLQVGNSPAKKLVFKGDGQYGSTTVHILVENGKYSMDGVKVSGFEIISTNYDRPENQKIINNILSSWQWK